MSKVDSKIINCKLYFESEIFDQGVGVAISGGKVAAIGKESNLPDADRIIDAHGWLVLPGPIDAHVHMGDPWEAPDKALAMRREDFASGTMAAAAGGITTIIDMPDNMPLVVSSAVFREKVVYCSKKAYIDFGLHGGFVPGMDYAKEIPSLWMEGAAGLKTFMCYSIDEWPAIKDGELLEALNIVSQINALAMIHAENDDILSHNKKRLLEKGRKDYSAHIEWRPPIAEIEAGRRVIFYLKSTGARGIIVHTSVPETVEEIGHLSNGRISVETCPHYLYLTDEDVRRKGPWLKCAPPLREKWRVSELRRMFANGLIDTVGSDHAPYTREEKAQGLSDIWKAANGIPGIEHMYPLLLNAVNEGWLSLHRLVKVTSENVARIYGIYPKKGKIQVGSDADFVVVDLKKHVKISDENTKMKVGWTPYDGFEAKGYPVMTIVRGEIVMDNGIIVGKPGYGKFVRRII
ncbi:MAG: dihydroorotase [Candidatus Bathyarchaeia archaeon]